MNFCLLGIFCLTSAIFVKTETAIYYCFQNLTQMLKCCLIIMLLRNSLDSPCLRKLTQLFQEMLFTDRSIHSFSEYLFILVCVPDGEGSFSKQQPCCVGFPGSSLVKNPPANAGDSGDTRCSPGWERSPGGGNGNPLQHSCLGNHMDRGAWKATIHGVTESWTQLSDWACMHACTYTIFKYSQGADNGVNIH